MNSTTNNTTTTNNIITNPVVVEDWQGGYKVELDISATDAINGWSLDFELPYNISEFYGVDLVNNGDGSYTITGQNDHVDLQSGQTIKPIFIVQDNGQEALTPAFKTIEASQPIAEPIAPPITEDTTEDSQPEVIEIPDNQAQSVGQNGKFNYGEALQKNFLFFEANESGQLSPNNRVAWRNDSTTNDGSTVGKDLSGGYFDAGDHVKFGQPMAASISMLALGGMEYKEAYQRAGQYDDLLEAVKHATDYFLKAHETDGNGNTSKLYVQVGEGGAANDHGYWGAPETVEANTTRNAFYISPDRPGSDVAASTASALAASSELFRGVDDAYADQLLKNAEQLFEFADTHRGKYSDSVSQANPFYTSWGGYGDDLALGAAMLAKVTGEEKYLTKAENLFKSEVGGLGDWSWAADEQSYAAGVILSQISDDSYFKYQVQGWLNNWVSGSAGINYTSGGFAHRASWGSVPVTSSAAFLAELYSDTVEYNQGYSDFATNQVDYILGDNPANLSYMVGFGDNYPQSPHHRGSSPNLKNDPTAPMENILYGAVVGGPDSPNDFAHNDRRDDWVTNEVGTSYNAPLASALIQQYDDLGGDPLSDAELNALPGIEIDGF